MVWSDLTDYNLDRLLARFARERQERFWGAVIVWFVMASENDRVLQNALLESIEEITQGREVSDFALSFPIVRAVWDLAELARQYGLVRP